jgi:atypical dual specificity phosphatase
MVKIGNIYRWVYGRIIGKPTNFNWLIEGKLAAGGIPMSLREIKWLLEQQGIRSIVTIKDKPLPSEWFNGNNSSSIGDRKIDYFHLSVKDYDAPSSMEELDYVVNYIIRQIDKGKRVMVHCSGGRGRTGTILAAYLIKKGNVLSAEQAIYNLRNIRAKSIQSKDQENIVFSYEKYLKSERQTENN